MAEQSSLERQLLKPVEPSELLKRLKLTTGKGAEFCGVSRRQLCYWTDTGIIPALEGEGEISEDDDSSRRSYDFDALHKVLLIKQVLKESPGLRKAARDVDQYLAVRNRRADDLITSIEQQRETFLTVQADKLEELADRIRELLPKMREATLLLQLYEGLEWLDRLASEVMAGELLLEEDAKACLQLATLVEQAEAKILALNSGPGHASSASGSDA